MSILRKKRIFLDISRPDCYTSVVSEWLLKLGSTTCAFLNKDIDLVITDRERQDLKSIPVSKKNNFKRSTAMLELAHRQKHSGSSSVWSVASQWSIKTLKYNDILFLMNKYPIKRNIINQVVKETTKKIHYVRKLTFRKG